MTKIVDVQVSEIRRTRGTIAKLEQASAFRREYLATVEVRKQTYISQLAELETEKPKVERELEDIRKRLDRAYKDLQNMLREERLEKTIHNTKADLRRAEAELKRLERQRTSGL